MTFTEAKAQFTHASLYQTFNGVDTSVGKLVCSKYEAASSFLALFFGPFKRQPRDYSYPAPCRHRYFSCRYCGHN